jgi:regulator of protease activity HflC (stomatin/prohibitin superfamily)
MRGPGQGGTGEGVRAVERKRRDAARLDRLALLAAAAGAGDAPAPHQQAVRQGERAIAEAEAEQAPWFGHVRAILWPSVARERRLPPE